jgi:hypothetical protein
MRDDVTEPSRPIEDYLTRPPKEWHQGDLATWNYAPADCLGYTVPIPCHIAGSERYGMVAVHCLRADGTWTDGVLAPVKELSRDA